MLASGDVSQFSASVDFGKLAARKTDDSGVPKTGHIDRIFASRYDFGQGVDYNRKCLTDLIGNGECTGRYVGQLQPYARLRAEEAAAGEGLRPRHLACTGCRRTTTSSSGSHEAEQMGERGSGSIIASPEGRGPDGSYKSYAEADVFEMWADVARHYHLNPDADRRQRLLDGRRRHLPAREPLAGPVRARLPDRRAADVGRLVQVAAQHPGDGLVRPDRRARRARDERGGVPRTPSRRASATTTGSSRPAGHITEGNNDEYGPAAAFFGDHTVDRDPAHVTYVVDPSTGNKIVSRDRPRLLAVGHRAHRSRRDRDDRRPLRHERLRRPAGAAGQARRRHAERRLARADPVHAADARLGSGARRGEGATGSTSPRRTSPP